MPFHLTLNEHVEAELMRVAREIGQNPADVLNQAVVEYLEELEDSRDGEAVLERMRSGDEVTYSPEEVKRRLGLDL